MQVRHREKRFKAFEDVLRAALTARGEEWPEPEPPEKKRSPRKATGLAAVVQEARVAHGGAQGGAAEPTLREMAALVGRGQLQVKETLDKLGREVRRAEAVLQDSYERRLRQTEQELQRVVRVRQDYVREAKAAAADGTVARMGHLNEMLEAAVGAQDDAASRLLEQSRLEKARVAAMRQAFTDEIEQARGVTAVTSPRSRRDLAAISSWSPQSISADLRPRRCASSSTLWPPTTAAPSRSEHRASWRRCAAARITSSRS